MSALQRVVKSLRILGLAMAVPSFALAQSGSGYVTQGVEYAPAGLLPGDQINPATSLGTNGGYLVWQDNTADGDGFGIMALRLDSSFSPLQSSFLVNQAGAADQENPQVSLLNNGGAVIVWQGGKASFQHIYARFLSSSNTFLTGDVLVNTTTNHYQANPVITTLANGNVVITWASYGQDNPDGLQGVYARLFSPAGAPLTGEIPINQFTSWNQRTPAVAALSGGSFVVAWVSEQQSFANSVGIYARMFDAGGSPLAGEFPVNTGTNVCANPAVAGASDGTFTVAWDEKDLVVRNNSWDVFARRFSAGGSGGAVQRVNTQLYGDQYAPKISSLGTDYLVCWTSMGQDGSREGVFGQFLNGSGLLSGGEFRVNTTTLNQQMFPALSSDGAGRFLVVWSSYSVGINSMDLNAQRYATYQQPLSPPGQPTVSALDSYTLSVTWSPLTGFGVDHWELYVDGAGTPVIVTNTWWQNEGLFDLLGGDYTFDPGSSHTFQLDYVLTDGRHSPLSTVASGKTWGIDRFGGGPNHLSPDGLPDDWETTYWGTNKVNWPGPNAVLGPGGPTVLQVFQWGANPLDSSTWLQQSLELTPQGLFLHWNTRLGSLYQVQSSVIGLGAWTNVGSLRFASDTVDEIFLGQPGSNVFYRVTRLVQ